MSLHSVMRKLPRRFLVIMQKNYCVAAVWHALALPQPPFALVDVRIGLLDCFPLWSLPPRRCHPSSCHLPLLPDPIELSPLESRYAGVFCKLSPAPTAPSPTPTPYPCHMLELKFVLSFICQGIYTYPILEEGLLEEGWAMSYVTICMHYPLP